MSSEFLPNPAEVETASNPQRASESSKVGPAQDRQNRIEKVIQAQRVRDHRFAGARVCRYSPDHSP